MNAQNIFQNIPADMSEEVAETLLNSASVRIERIVSNGHCSAPDFWYDQAQSEWVLLMKGEAGLEFESDGRIVHLLKGSFINIAAHERHRVAWTAEGQETVWLAVFY